MAAKPFISATVTLSKTKFKQMVEHMIDYALDDQYNDEVLKKCGVSTKSIVSLLEKDQTYIANFQKRFSSAVNEMIVDHLVNDPDQYDFYEVSSNLLDEVFERLDESQEEYDEQAELLRQSSFTPQVQKAVNMLKAKGFKVYSPAEY